MTRWKQISETTLTGFIDKNNCNIALGDTLRYKRKVKCTSRWRENCTVIDTPGHYEQVEVKVVGFGKQVRKHWKRGFESIEYIHVKETNNSCFFRIYRTDLVEIV